MCKFLSLWPYVSGHTRVEHITLSTLALSSDVHYVGNITSTNAMEVKRHGTYSSDTTPFPGAVACQIV